MKKLFLTIALAMFCLGVNAQQGERTGLVKLAYQTEWSNIGIGVEGRQFITDNIRLAPDAIFYLPKNNAMGLDINVNGHYVFPLDGGISLYPLAGLAMSNTRYSAHGVSVGTTNYGLNIGAGGGYELSSNSYLNAELRLTFSKGDYTNIMVGYGVKF